MTKAGIMINHLEFIINAKHLLNSEHNLGGHFSMKDHDLCTVIMQEKKNKYPQSGTSLHLSLQTFTE